MLIESVVIKAVTKQAVTLIVTFSVAKGVFDAKPYVISTIYGPMGVVKMGETISVLGALHVIKSERVAGVT